jgi:hypothetical protein
LTQPAFAEQAFWQPLFEAIKLWSQQQNVPASASQLCGMPWYQSEHVSA